MALVRYDVADHVATITLDQPETRNALSDELVDDLIGALGKPSLCAANGHVLAGALGVALACDLIIAR